MDGLKKKFKDPLGWEPSADKIMGKLKKEGRKRKRPESA